MSEGRFASGAPFFRRYGGGQGQHVGQLGRAGGGREGRARDVFIGLFFNGIQWLLVVEFGEIIVQVAGGGDRVGDGVGLREL